MTALIVLILIVLLALFAWSDSADLIVRLDSLVFPFDDDVLDEVLLDDDDVSFRLV